MSYLGPLRMHFAGRFQAAPSTVNNDALHYDNTTFLAEYQELGDPQNPRGWWNPRGDADWRLIECGVTSAWLADGTATASGDPVLGMLVADSDRRPPAKLVDLDPCQQMVSTIWGLEVRIADRQGNTLVRGAYEPAPFFDIWNRAPGRNSDRIACASYQSVITDLVWADVGASPFLAALRQASADGLLSIKFMVDGYNDHFGADEFTRGRIVGTIGPARNDEPRQMVLGRQLVAKAKPGTSETFFTPDSVLSHSVAAVDRGSAKIYLDIGNALPTPIPGGDIEDQGELKLYVGEHELCPVPYSTGDWYAQSAGVVALPADRELTVAELEQLAGSPLTLKNAAGNAQVAEAPLYVRADQLVYRCDPGEKLTVRLYASRLGEPYEGATVQLAFDPSQLQAPEPIVVGLPLTAVDFPTSVVTGAGGLAAAQLTISDPGNERKFIDGQVYGIRPKLAEDKGSQEDQYNFVSLLVWSGFEPDEPPTWYGSLQPIFQQYANLYPVMQDFLDLSDYEDVCANVKLLRLAFGLEPADPNSMPVTRDLSSAKRAAIGRWLEHPGADGKPLKGTPPPKPAAADLQSAAEPAGAPADVSPGGKAMAAARRLSIREADR